MEIRHQIQIEHPLASVLATLLQERVVHRIFHNILQELARPSNVDEKSTSHEGGSLPYLPQYRVH